MEVLLILGIILAVVVVIVYRFYAASARRNELWEWASAHGLEFSAAKDRGMDDRFDEFRCLRRGHSRYAYNIMHGQWDGLALAAFDYHYATGRGKSRNDHHFSAVVVGSPIPLKPLFIRPEGFFDKVGEFFGFDDIDFESAEFSRKFYVTSPDRRWAYAVIHQGMMEYLLAAPGFSVEFGHGHMIAWRSGCLSPAELDVAVRFVRGVQQRLPEYLVREQAGQG